MLYKYLELSEDAKKTAREGLIIDSKEFFEETMTEQEAHEDLIYNNDKNLFDENGILISNGGMYAG